MQNQDVIVLGAGIVGVSTALHLQARGRSVCLVDNREPGEGTSFGNAGLIERSSVVPYAFPRKMAALLRYGLNRQADVRYDPIYLPKIASFLFRYWRESSPARLQIATRAMLPLVEASIHEHDVLIEKAGAGALIRSNGWIDTYRTPAAFEAYKKSLADLDRFHLDYEVLDSDALHRRDPAIGEVAGGVHWKDPKSVTDPGGLVKAYAALFAKNGGIFIKADAATLTQTATGWQVTGDDGPIAAREAVVALGPQAGLIYKRLGYAIPMAIKRGYHLHFNTTGNATLEYSHVDGEGGYVLAPMVKGIRLTTGIEFADPLGPINTIQLKRAETLARRLFPSLGQQLETTPWLGLRPCLPDMRPVIGEAPRHKGLWFNFGHAHHGLTLGPATGRLLAEMMTGEKPFADPSAFAASRFN